MRRKYLVDFLDDLVELAVLGQAQACLFLFELFEQVLGSVERQAVRLGSGRAVLLLLEHDSATDFGLPDLYDDLEVFFSDVLRVAGVGEAETGVEFGEQLEVFFGAGVGFGVGQVVIEKRAFVASGLIDGLDVRSLEIDKRIIIIVVLRLGNRDFLLRHWSSLVDSERLRGVLDVRVQFPRFVHTGAFSGNFVVINPDVVIFVHVENQRDLLVLLILQLLLRGH